MEAAMEKRSRVARSTRGFALVELLLAALVLSILVAVIVMTIANINNDGSSPRACRTEAREFAVAAQSYHKRHDNRAWPDDHTNESVELTNAALVFTGELPKGHLRYLDGSQRSPASSSKGWTYDFKAHTTNALGCG
jgi:competence protein ComGC